MTYSHIHFGPFTIEVEGFVVLKEGRELKTRTGKRIIPRAVRILIVLVENRGKIVRADDLKELLDQTTDDDQRRIALTKYIAHLRASMGDLFDENVLTISKKRDVENKGGYKFVGNAQLTNEAALTGQIGTSNDSDPDDYIATPTGGYSLDELDERLEPGDPELLRQIEALQGQDRPLAAECLLNSMVRTSAHLRHPDLIKKLQAIRDRNILEFFNPENSLPTTIVFDRAYANPTPHNKKSTTEMWAFNVQLAFLELQQTRGLNQPIVRPANYDPSTIPGLVREPSNLISYASSKINPCTEGMLEILNQECGIEIGFIYEADAERIPPRSAFTIARQSERAALLFRGKVLKYEETGSTGRDHGILIRYRFPDDKRQWIIFAGCSRPGSVASGLLVFDRDFGNPLWGHPVLQESLRSFLCVFETSFTPPNNAEPHKVKVLELLQFS